MIFGEVVTDAGTIRVAAVGGPQVPGDDAGVTLWLGGDVLCRITPDDAVTLGVALIQAAVQGDPA